MSIRIETVRTDAFSMDFFRFGRGPRPLVILPGLSVQSVMGAAEAVAAAYRSLEDQFTIYVFDRRRELPPVYTVEDMARDTAAAFETLGLENVCLFGASQGGMIALVIAIEHPELVGKLALGSSAANVRPAQYRVVEEWIRLAQAKDRAGLYLSFGREVYPAKVFAQYRDMLLAAAETVTDEDLQRFIRLAEGMKGFDVTDQLSRIRCPVLALGSYEDRVLGDDATMEIAAKLDERAALYLYVGYGHAAYDTAPDYRERLLRFFSGEAKTAYEAAEEACGDAEEASLDGEETSAFRVISNQVRFGCGYRLHEGRRQYFAWHGYPNRNDDYFTTSEISESEYRQIQKEYPRELSADRATAERFRGKYVDGHPVILEGWNRLL